MDDTSPIRPGLDALAGDTIIRISCSDQSRRDQIISHILMMPGWCGFSIDSRFVDEDRSGAAPMVSFGKVAAETENEFTIVLWPNPEPVEHADDPGIDGPTTSGAELDAIYPEIRCETIPRGSARPDLDKCQSVGESAEDVEGDGRPRRRLALVHDITAKGFRRWRVTQNRLSVTKR